MKYNPKGKFVLVYNDKTLEYVIASKVSVGAIETTSKYLEFDTKEELDEKIQELGLKKMPFMDAIIKARPEVAIKLSEKKVPDEILQKRKLNSIKK